MVSNETRPVINILVLDDAPLFPERIILELKGLAEKLQHIRKVYLGTTHSKRGYAVPLLVVESIGAKEKEVDDDLFVLETAMNQFFQTSGYEVQVIPTGKWWDKIKPVVQVVRDLNG